MLFLQLGKALKVLEAEPNGGNDDDGQKELGEHNAKFGSDGGWGSRPRLKPSPMPLAKAGSGLSRVFALSRFHTGEPLK